MVVKAFGGRVRAERERLGLSQRELASRLGRSDNYFSVLERTNDNQTIRMLVDLSHELGISLHWLLTGEGSRKVGTVEELSARERRCINKYRSLPEGVQDWFEATLDSLVHPKPPDPVNNVGEPAEYTEAPPPSDDDLKG